MENGSIITKNDVQLIKCIECDKPLNILEEYDYYDLNRYFVKECCGHEYTLVQYSYIFGVKDIELDENFQIE